MCVWVYVWGSSITSLMRHPSDHRLRLCPSESNLRTSSRGYAVRRTPARAVECHGAWNDGSGCTVKPVGQMDHHRPSVLFQNQPLPSPVMSLYDPTKQ